MLSATIGNTGYTNIPGNTGIGVFAVAASNLATPGPVTVSGGPLNAGTPVVVTLCETDPASGNCQQPPASQVTVPLWAANENRTFAFFVQGTASVADNPATNRVNATAVNAQNNKVGGTGVAVRTTHP
jgi:hypothetical protein